MVKAKLIALLLAVGAAITLARHILMRHATDGWMRSIKEYEEQFHTCGVCGWHRWARQYGHYEHDLPPGHHCINRGRYYPDETDT